MLLFLGFCRDNSWPYTAIKEAKSLIPRIEEIRPYVEENWELINEVNKIVGAHDEFSYLSKGDDGIWFSINRDSQYLYIEDVNFLSEEEKQIISALFEKDVPFIMSHNVLYTGLYGDAELMRLDICYIPEIELSQRNERIYYMEELAPDWYACTNIAFKVRGIDIAYFKAQREDGGLVRLSDRP